MLSAAFIAANSRALYNSLLSTLPRKETIDQQESILSAIFFYSPLPLPFVHFFFSIFLLLERNFPDFFFVRNEPLQWARNYTRGNALFKSGLNKADGDKAETNGVAQVRGRGFQVKLNLKSFLSQILRPRFIFTFSTVFFVVKMEGGGKGKLFSRPWKVDGNLSSSRIERGALLRLLEIV